MKILIVGHTYSVAANHAKIAALARIPEAQVTLVTPHGWRGPLYDNRTDRFKGPEKVNHKILRAYLIGKEGAYFYGPSIYRLIARVKPDIVHVEQGAYAVSYTQILLALKLFSPRSKVLFFTWWNLPYQARGVKRLTERFNLRHSSAAIAGNSKAKGLLEDHGFRNPVFVLPQLGMDLPPLPARRSIHDKFVVGYAGRIAQEKGVLDLVDAIATMTERASTVLHLVGSGDALAEVKRRAAYHGIAIEHHPPVRNDELGTHFARMDALVLPSRSTPEWVEQFGHILLEAMAFGVPVIGSSSGEIPNVIGDAGLIFPEGDAAGLAKELDSLFASPMQREELSRRGRDRVAERFTNDRIARQQYEIYEHLLGMRGDAQREEALASV